MRCRVLVQHLSLLLLLNLTITAFATEWNGQSISSGDWSDAGNWAFCIGLAGCDGPESDDTADFGPLGIRTTTNVDYARSIKGIKYELGARLYSISGSQLTIGEDGIKNWSNEDQEINTDILLSTNQRWGQQIIYPNNNARLQINGNVNINGNALALGTTESRTLLGLIDTPRTWVTVNGGLSGSGQLQADGAILTGANSFRGNIVITTGGALHLTGNGASLSNSNEPDVYFFGDDAPNARTFGVFRVDDEAWANLDSVTAENDYHGKVYIGADSEVRVGRNNSSFFMNTLIQGEGAHNNSRLLKDGSGTVTINTQSFDAGDFVGSGGVETIVRNGTLTLTGNHSGDHDFEVQSGARLELELAQGFNETITHRISGDGTVAKTGNGIAFIDSPLAFTGDFDMEQGLVFLARDNAFSGANTLNLNAGIFKINGHKVAFSQIINGAGRIDLDGGELTIGQFNVGSGNTVLDENDHSGNGTLIKTGLDNINFTHQWGRFTGEVRVEQGTFNAFITGRRGRARSLFDLEMTGGRYEQHYSFHEFGSANTAVGSVLDLNNTTVTFGELNVDAGAASRIGGELLGRGELIKRGLQDLIIDDADAFTGQFSVEQGQLLIGDTEVNASAIAIGADAGLVVGARTNEVIDSALSGNGTITKNNLTTTTINNATGFNGSILVNRGKLATGNSPAFGEGIDVHVVKGSFGGGPLIDPIENQLDVNAAQGFGRLTGNGIVDFSSAISVGNENKSSKFDGTLRSTGFASVVKKGSGKVILDADQDFRGSVNIQDGELQINGKLHADTGLNIGFNNVQIANAAGDAKLSGSGQVGRITGNGIVAPGESPGILTAHSIIVSNGIDFQFEFTGVAPNYQNADNSVNDLIRLTDISSLSGTLTSENVISLYLDVDFELDGASVDGGFFSRRFLSPLFLEQASYEIFVSDALGPESYEGKLYSALDMNLWELTLSQIGLSRRFEGDVSSTFGYVTRFSFNDLSPDPVPLPAGFWLMLSGAAALGFRGRRRTTIKL